MLPEGYMQQIISGLVCKQHFENHLHHLFCPAAVSIGSIAVNYVARSKLGEQDAFSKNKPHMEMPID